MEAAGGEARIVRIGVERLAELEPLHRALDERHREIAADLERVAPRRESAELWRDALASFEATLREEPDAFALGAEVGDALVGLAFVGFRANDTAYDAGDRFADLEVLAVLPGFRGRGIGRALFEAARREAAALGVRIMSFGVMAGNGDAARFYERLGAVPFVSVYWVPAGEPAAERGSVLRRG